MERYRGDGYVNYILSTEFVGGSVLLANDGTFAGISVNGAGKAGFSWDRLEPVYGRIREQDANLLSLFLILSKIMFFVGFACIGVGFYQQNMLVKEWAQDHAAHLSRPARWLLSSQAMLSRSLSERCRRRRRKLLAAAAGAFLLMPSAVLLQIWLA